MSRPATEKRRSIHQLKSRLLDQVWGPEVSELTRVKRLLHSVVKMSVMVGQDFVENLVKLQAMALAFKTLLSLAPLLAVIFSILKGLGVHNRMEPALTQALAPLGEKGQEITAHLIGFVDRMSAGVGSITLFVTVLSLMGSIEQAFNYIWRVRSPRRFARKFSDYLSVLLVGPVLVFAAVTITATLQSTTLVKTLTSFQPFGMVILFLLRLIPYFTLWGAFSFFYIFIPNTRVKLTSALVGGLVAALLWETVGWGFAVFVASSTRYYAIYSSFAVLVLFLFWLHISWVIVLLGAQVAHAHQNIHFYRDERDLLAQSPAGREKLALQMMLLVGRNFYRGLDPMGVSELANQMRVPAGLIKDLMEVFHKRRLVLPLADEETFVLGRDPETIGVKEVLDCVRYSGEKKLARADSGKAEDEIDDVLLEVEQSVAEVLEGKSLKSLITGQNRLSTDR
jgi:membrane protein